MLEVGGFLAGKGQFGEVGWMFILKTRVVL